MLAETAIPVMLVVRRWRLAGVLLAFAFHFALAMDPGDVVFNFSAILLAFFFLFLPDEFAASLATTLSAHSEIASPERFTYLRLRSKGWRSPWPSHSSRR